VINNTVTGSKAETAQRGAQGVRDKHKSFPDQVTYPDIASVQGTPLEPAVMYPPPPPQQLKPRDYTADEDIDVPLPISASKFAEMENQLLFYKQLATTFAGLLKSANSKLILNLIDTSGKIIVDSTSLCKIIGLITNEAAEDVVISYEAGTGEGCTTKVNPISKIKAIKIKCCDFNLRYNEHYNMLTDTYAVSLKKVFVVD
jgi:hypothetical protein